MKLICFFNACELSGFNYHFHHWNKSYRPCETTASVTGDNHITHLCNHCFKIWQFKIFFISYKLYVSATKCKVEMHARVSFELLIELICQNKIIIISLIKQGRVDAPIRSSILTKIWHIDGLVQDCSNSIANALELLQSCASPRCLVYILTSLWFILPVSVSQCQRNPETLWCYFMEKHSILLAICECYPTLVREKQWICSAVSKAMDTTSANLHIGYNILICISVARGVQMFMAFMPYLSTRFVIDAKREWYAAFIYFFQSPLSLLIE